MAIQLERDDVDQAKGEWEQLTLLPFMERRPERRSSFRTLSGTELQRLYTPTDVADALAVQVAGFKRKKQQDGHQCQCADSRETLRQCPGRRASNVSSCIWREPDDTKDL